MGWIVDAGLRFRRLLLAVAAGVMVVGIVQVGKTPVDALPEFNPPMVEVQTEALGLSAEEVEQLITVPLEQDLLVGVPFLDKIESVSMPGLSSVVMTFEPGTDLLDARQLVQERLTQAVGAAGLPQVAKPPQMLQPLSSSSRVAMVELSSERLSPIEVSVLARWVIGPRLLGVPGVANVATWGSRDRQLQVLVDPQRLAANDATLAQVVQTAGNALEVSPLSFLEASKPGTGGFIDTPNQRLNIFHEQAIKTAAQLAKVPLEDVDGAGALNANRPVTLGDVTEVVEDHQPLIGDAVCPGGKDCLLLVIEKFPGANTIEVTRGIEDALTTMQPGLADIEFDSSIYRPASFVESSFENVGWALLAGGLLLLLVVVGLFWDWRRSLVTVAAMGVSLATAVLVLQLSGVTVDLFVAAGLVVGLTVVIHDAVTDVDGLADRLRRRDPDHPVTSAWKVIVETSAEIRRSVLYAALVVAAATLPLFFLGAEGGTFLPPLALAYLLAVAASMLVAVVVTPGLALMLLSKPRGTGSPVANLLRRGYDRVAPRLLPRTRAAIGVAVGTAVVGLAMAPLLDSALRPSLEERTVLVHIKAAPGTSLTSMTATTDDLVEEVGSLSGVANVGSHVGRAVMADEIVDVNSGEIWVHLASDSDYDDTVTAIESAVGDSVGISTDVLTYSDERVIDVLGRSGNEVVLRAYGEDPDVLDGMAEDLQAMVAGVEGVARASVDRAPEEATMEVEVDLEDAEAFGLKPGDVRRAAASLLGGITVGNLFDEQKVFDVVVWGAPDIRNSASDIEQLLVDTPDGGTVRLGSVADVRIVSNPATIRHEAVSGYLDVVAQVPGGDVGDVRGEIDELVDGVDFPKEHHAEIVGGSADQADAWQMAAAVLAGVFGIFLLLQAAFGSWRLALLGFAALPLALVGGVVAVLLSGGTITIGSVAGLLALLGIAARGVVVLIRRYQFLQRHDGRPFGPDLVLSGTRDTLLPTLMSTLGMAVLLAPIAVVGGVTGFDIVGPMAIVVLGGLVTTVLVNLFLVPAMYLRFGFVGRDGWPDDLFDDVPEQARERADAPAGATQRRSVKAAWPIVIPALFVSACGGAVADEYVAEHEPGKAVPIPGTHHTRVVLEQQAADRLRIQTAPVKKTTDGLVVPAAAVFVDTEGQWWVFTEHEPLEYVRHKVDIGRQQQGRAILTSGPPAGTEVVTVGVMELFGVEEEVGH